jgi:hypothetical protein
MSKMHANGATRVQKAEAAAHPIFDAMIEEARRASGSSDISHEELGRQPGITEEERARARATIATWEPDGPDDGCVPPTNGSPAGEAVSKSTRA